MHKAKNCGDKCNFIILEMVQVQSKLSPISATCVEYVHPWTSSCLQAISGLYLYSVMDSLRIYGTVYVVRIVFVLH